MRQQSLEVAGLGHGSAPIPMGCRVGNVIMTSGISGKDPATGRLPEDAEAQAVLCFENLKAVLAAGGMGLGDVVKVTVYIAEEAHRAAVNAPWLACWPDPHHRPARHALTLPLRGGVKLQIEAFAVAPTPGIQET
jgi:2-iminobutanoate/2-iminopropanoate deaminase